jgi:hypothetical protein
MSTQSNTPSDVALERHYTISEIAEMWHLEYKKVQRLFMDVDGVLKEVTDGTLKKQRYTLLRVPESIVIQVHRKLRTQ